MNNYEQGEWVRFSGKKRVPLPYRCKVSVELACTSICVVSVVDADGDAVPIQASHTLNSTFTTTGYSELEIDTGKAVAGLRLSLRGLQTEEPRHDRPVPPVPQTTHILQKLRAEARRSMNVQREAFAERDVSQPGYETDDGEDLFEEDLIARSQHHAAPGSPPSAGSEPVEPADVSEKRDAE